MDMEYPRKFSLAYDKDEEIKAKEMLAQLLAKIDTLTF